MSTFDITIIGSGPGGYVAAIRCAQLGMKTALIEKYNTLGGTCLNVGCIPSKALLDSSEHFHNATHNFDEHGIDITGVKANIKQMIKRKNDVVAQTSNGVKFLMDKNDVEVFHGEGSFVDKNTVKVLAADGTETVLSTKNVLVATGSKPNFFPGMEPDKKRIITSTEALSLEEIPGKLIVIGGGVIGLELGSVFGRLGSQVEVVEFAKTIVPTMDKTMSKELTKVLKKEGFKFHLQHQVQNVENTGKGVTLTALNKKGEEVTMEADYCLVAVGRKPFTKGLGLENAGITVNTRGEVEVNEHLQTNVPNIYAIGDVVRGPMLAHKAEEEGVYVAELLAGQKPHMNYDLIPGVVYTWPEVASVGKTEDELVTAGKEIKIGQFPIKALGRARASMDILGTIKIIADAETDEVLGVHIIAPRAADLIMEAVVAMEYRASAEDIARICHPHPTYSEGVKEAALAATENRPLHI
ncbi:MAG: dihydrolipoyl dehydrogenase [Crocinitomicaceae bacterium]|jgi:dihydrolipoamide dehydrogenase|nr:dihydrolipoyl dehydrogenase [Crocinitomicaceae bacterium]MDG1658945.1 dihydrolipoyl dehydrogenase [Crocinitomicaceae bacterium]MDG2441501.1 dihydrolipoyl dehydrogenase [Crocinitomicaceae bacterium]